MRKTKSNKQRGRKLKLGGATARDIDQSFMIILSHTNRLYVTIQ